jgi:hypothetical protein
MNMRDPARSRSLGVGTTLAYTDDATRRKETCESGMAVLSNPTLTAEI